MLDLIYIITALLISVVLPIMSLRGISGDEHYGNVGLGSMVLSAADTFSTARMPAFMEPDIIISNKKTQKLLDINIDDILVFDCRKWNAHSAVLPDLATTVDTPHVSQAGIIKDNTAAGLAGPTANTIAQGTRPGGVELQVTGNQGGATAVQMVGEQVPRYEAYFDFQMDGVEEQTTVGQILTEGRFTPKNAEEGIYSPYEVDGITVHNLLTAAHYHFWAATDTKQSAAAFQIGMNAKRVSVDFEEVMFDREVLISILDALVVST